MKKKKSAFTLIELIVTVVILGILAGVAILSYVDVTRTYKEAVARSNLQILKSALYLYKANHNGAHPTNILSDSHNHNGLDAYLDDSFVRLIKDTDHPYHYSLHVETDRIVIKVKGPNLFEEIIVVPK